LCFDDAASKCQPESGALLGAAACNLLEFLKQKGLLFRRDADPGIFDFHSKIAVAGGCHPHVDAPAIGGELDGVGEVVIQDLLEAGGVNYGIEIRNAGSELDVLPFGQGSDYVAHFMY
jgi:hypothetical protein